MPAPVTFNEIIDELKEKLDTISGIGQVDVNPGGPSPWALTRQAAGHWWLDVYSTKHQITQVPGASETMWAKQVTLVLVEGWLPYSESGNTAETWRGLMDSVIAKILSERSLGLGLILEMGPKVLVDTTALKSSGNQGDTGTKCHYCRIACRWAQEYQFTVVG